MATKKAASSTKKKTTTTTVKSVSSKNGKSVKRFSLINAPLASAAVAEFIGIFLFTASIFAVQGQPLFVAFALIGLVILVGRFSGAHLNPAITIAAWATRKVNSIRAFVYIVMQVVGALAAYLVLSAFLDGTKTEEAASMFATAPQLFHAATLPEGKEWYIFFAELLGTAVLGFGVATALKEKKERIVAASSVGFAILIGLLLAGSVTGNFLTEANTALTFLNPAVVAAAAGLSFDAWVLAIYVAAPILGATVAFALQDLLSSQSKEA
jgi:glycerol uptake facilitator-like aquaporin